MGGYYEDPGDGGSLSQAFRDPLELLVNPGTVGAAHEVGIADTNLASAILRGADPIELGVPSTTRLVITSTIYDELMATGAFTKDELGEALKVRNIQIVTPDGGDLINNLWETGGLLPEGSLSPIPARAENQLRDATIVTEAKTLNLPVFTNNVRDFNVNVNGGGRLAERLRVEVVRTGNLNDLRPRAFPRLTDAVRSLARRVVP